MSIRRAMITQYIQIAAEKLFDGCYIVSGEVPKEKMATSSCRKDR